MQPGYGFEAAIGTTAYAKDVITEVPIAALWVTLDRPGVSPKSGEPIPLGWHVLYFLPKFRPHELRSDGSPRRTAVLPELPFKRRVFGGLRLNFFQPLRVGDSVDRKTELVELDLKHGRSGRLCVATVKSEIRGPHGLALTETITTIFRDEPASTSTRPSRTTDEEASREALSEASKTIYPDTVLLTRYSALTFNSHRIHFDRPYAMEIEKYPGLLVHGPLLANLILDFAVEKFPGKVITSYSMRAFLPVFDISPFKLDVRATESGCRVWVSTPESAAAMIGEVEFACGAC